MSLLEILKLVGFATGAALHLYIALLIWKKRLGSRHNLTQAERTFIVLGLCVGGWFLGNLLTTLHVLLLGYERLTLLLRVWDTITMTGVALVPSAMLHAHFAVWSSFNNDQTVSTRHVRIAGLAFYAPMIALPYAVYLINSGEYQTFFVKLRPLLIPYSIWYMYAFWSSAAIDWVIKDRLDRSAVRERVFFKRLAIFLFLIGAFEFVVVGLLRTSPNDYLWVIYILMSLAPTFFVAYYVYRYRLVDILIKGSLVYAAFAVIFITVYTYGVRQLDEFFASRGSRPGVIEAILILGMFALAGPLMRVMDRMVGRLFAHEIGLYRDVVRQVSAGAAGFGDLGSLVRYTEETIREGLDLAGVRILLFDSILSEGPDKKEIFMRRLAEKMVDWEGDMIEMDEDLSEIGATVAYALRRDGRVIGLMIISAGPYPLTSEKRAVLDVLAGQVAIEIESCRLVEEKVRLERELANRERLATLGQMAATVAHEVKNPLSAIKSIAQVMREEESLKDYDRDLGLIVSEIDRLNRTVSQLLAFSRPSRASSRNCTLSDLLGSIATLLATEAKERNVKINIAEGPDVTLTGEQSAALREALGNLLLNAVQATGSGGEVRVAARLDGDKRDTASQGDSHASKLILTVSDTGPGITEDEQRRIFEPFYTTKSRGTGLGLAIVQRRAAELGGSLDLKSPVRDGHGTEFKMSVPLAPVPEES
ncbi:MAG: ATP-binding protein [Blastocatellia bacterium]|nr:ATP-binding protein [Blastocatellia bacterium]